MKLRIEREPLIELGLAEVARNLPKNQRGGTFDGGTLADPTPDLIRSFHGLPSTSGVPVSSETAMTISTVHACVRILSGLGASLPLQVYQATDRGPRLAKEHRLYPLLHDAPNPQQSSFLWREAEWTNELLWGNSYTQIEYDGAGRVQGLWPIQASRVTPQRVTDRNSPSFGEIVYTVDNSARGTVRLLARQMLHIPGLGFDGVMGRSRITYFREGLGLALATERHGSSFFGAGGMPPVALTHPGKGNREAAKKIKGEWHEGRDNLDNVVVLFDGMKAEPISINHVDLQYLETRTFQVEEVCRMFLVPTWMVAAAAHASNFGTGIEQQFIAFLTISLVPELRRREQTMNMQLFSPADQAAGFYVEHVVEGILRADSADRSTFYKVMREMGAFSVDDVLRKENLPTIGGDAGSERIRPANMVPIGTPAPAAPAAFPAGRSEDLPAIDRASFKPLIQDAFERAIRRAKQDWPGMAKRGEQAAWAEDFHRNARRQLALVGEAMGEGGAVDEWVAFLPKSDGELPDSWDVTAIAASVAEKCIGG